MDLFTHSSQNQIDQSHTSVPLAERFRPQDLAEVFGQEKVLGGVLGHFIRSGSIPSVILWGPPGCGKTTIAMLLAKNIDATFVAQNAIDLGSREIKSLGQESQERKSFHNRNTILFIDEIHRLNKSQQDNLLPFVERGDFTLIGATTENPSYEINSALLSRCQLIVLNRLSEESLNKILSRALKKIGLEQENILSSESRSDLVAWANGDARSLLNGTNLIWKSFLNPDVKLKYTWPLNKESLKDIIGGGRPLYYDKKSDSHYDTISAFIKSVRNSDPDAAIYYLARMLKGGEDPKFIARRLVVLASEDIGNADPRGLMMATAGFQAVEMIGMPEAAINLAHVTTFLACAPKSNKSYEALRKAEAEVDATGNLPLPSTFKADYKYSHDFNKAWVDQDLMPKGLRSRKFYEPTDRGHEKIISQFLNWLRG